MITRPTPPARPPRTRSSSAAAPSRSLAPTNVPSPTPYVQVPQRLAVDLLQKLLELLPHLRAQLDPEVPQHLAPLVDQECLEDVPEQLRPQRRLDRVVDVVLREFLTNPSPSPSYLLQPLLECLPSESHLSHQLVQPLRSLRVLLSRYSQYQPFNSLYRPAASKARTPKRNSPCPRAAP